MNWYKKSTTSLYDIQNIPQNTKNPSPKPGAEQLLNYIKSKGIKIQTYHGTTLAKYNSALKDGYLLSGGRVGQNLKGTQVAKKNFVYVSTKKAIAMKYAEKFAANAQTKPNATQEELTAVVIPLLIPLYTISELRGVLFGGITGQNQNLFDNDLNTFMENTLDNNPQDYEREEAIQNAYVELSKQEELTVYLGIPLKWRNGEPEIVRVFKPMPSIL